jgi:hypothetical protein
MSIPSTALSSNGYVIQNPNGTNMTPLVPPPSASQPASPAAAAPTQPSSLASGVKGLFGKIGAGLKAALSYLALDREPRRRRCGELCAVGGAAPGGRTRAATTERRPSTGLRAVHPSDAGVKSSTNAARNRQHENPAQRDAREIANTEDRNALTNANELGPGQIVASPRPTGGYGQFRVRGNNAEPIMTHSQMPNPTQAAGAGTVPPLGGMHLIPPAQSSNQATQLTALPKGPFEPTSQPKGAGPPPLGFVFQALTGARA